MMFTFFYSSETSFIQTFSFKHDVPCDSFGSPNWWEAIGSTFNQQHRRCSPSINKQRGIERRTRRNRILFLNFYFLEAIKKYWNNETILFFFFCFPFQKPNYKPDPINLLKVVTLTSLETGNFLVGGKINFWTSECVWNLNWKGESCSTKFDVFGKPNGCLETIYFWTFLQSFFSL